ncbi:hypothetical protein CFC21_091852 [Triticum aestivum]|uniref:Uncharacterized protein n=2 Tax=Triticum aestivum TaxID=4565 RepID=A0A3B6QEH1_WHEAT|nr:hypothetical protein CFC21_091852 [Triticum aestivum]
MAGNEGFATKRVLGRCTAEEISSDPAQQKSAIDGFGTPERCATLPTAVTREYALLKRKSKEADQDHDEEQEQEKEINEILATAKLPRRADVVSVAAAEPMVVDPFLEQDIAKATVSEPQADAEIEEPVSEPQAEAEIKEHVSEPQADAEIEEPVSEPQAEAEIKKPVSEPQAEAEIEEPVSEPQAEAEDQDVYADEDADYDYQDGSDYDGYYDEDEDDYESEYDDDYDDDDYDDDDYDWESEFAKHRPVVRETLLNFPEAANLEPQELDAAVERVLEQSKPEYRDVAAPGKVRLLKNDIRLILAEKWEPHDIHKLLSTLSPAEMIKRSEELDKELPPGNDKEADDRFAELQAKVRKDLIEKGYAEVDEDFYDNRGKFWEELREEWNKIDFSRFRFASSEDGILRYSEELGDFI